MSAPVVVRGMSDTAYHQDPALSSTGAKLLLDCPARYHHAVTTPPESRDYYELGHAVHALVLGQGRDIVDVGPDLRSAAAKAKRDAAIEAGVTWLRTADYDTAHRMRDAVMGNELAAAALTGGEAEVSMWATDPITGVRMRARPDYMRPGLMVDLKTTASGASVEAFALEAGKRAYHLSAAFYLHVANMIREADIPEYHHLLGRPGDEPLFLHVVVEKQAPFLVSVVQLDTAALAAGREAVDVALRRFADCTDAGAWPGYETDVVPLISLRPWHLRTPNDEGDDQ